CEAQAEYGEALRILEPAYGGEHPDVALVLAGLAEVERKLGNLERGEQLARRALGLRRKALGNGHPQVAASLNNLAILLEQRGRPAEAARMLRPAAWGCTWRATFGCAQDSSPLKRCGSRRRPSPARLGTDRRVWKKH
ncbi:MAG: tetratricopeptide repeat protein, partial [Gemmataceae bacterium]|nr:tetratricopeptide repeat protein [Gemmataceae bacterium]